jgi:polyvinyl alcohol dehydrogenase (cytochrome)
MAGFDVHRWLLLGGVGAMVLAGTTVGVSMASASPAGCAAAAEGGDWPGYGHDLSNTRTQPDETDLGPSQASTLAPVWTATVVSGSSTTSSAGASQLNSTPIVVDGCVFAGGTDGTEVALNADTGALVWRSPVLGDVSTAGGGGLIVGAAAVTGGNVIVPVNQSGGPFLVALSERTGHVVWTSAPIYNYPGANTNGSVVAYNGLVLLGFSPPEGDPNGQGGIAILSAANGKILDITDTVPKTDQSQGFAGGGVWSTPAIDPTTGFAYIGAGNPYDKQADDRNTNAILKMDLKPGPQFGRIVAAYKGNVDQYQAPELAQSPVCAASESTPLDTFPLDDPGCGQLDLDFGASPNLFTDKFGNLLVGDLQKSGYYHAAYADTMEGDWATPVGGPCALCNAASPAVAGGSVFAVGTPGGVAVALDGSSGSPQWASPVADGAHYGAVSTADGVAYTVDSLGALDAFDTSDGAPVLHLPLIASTQQVAAGLTSAGVAIARHTVYVEVGGDIVALQPNATP